MHACFPTGLAVSDAGIVVSDLAGAMVWPIDGAAPHRIAGAQCKVDPSGRFLYSTEGPELKLVEIADPEGVRTIAVQLEPHSQLAFSGDGCRVVVFTPPRLEIWDVAGAVKLAEHRIANEEGLSLAVDSAGRVVLAGRTLFDTERGRALAQLKIDERVAAACFSSSGRVAVSTFDKKLHLFETSSGRRRAEIGGTGVIRGAVFDVAGDRLLSASDNKSVKLWDVATAKARATFRAHQWGARHVAFLLGSERLVSQSGWSMRIFESRAMLLQAGATTEGEWFVRAADGRWDGSPGFRGIRWWNDARDRTYLPGGPELVTRVPGLWGALTSRS